MEMLECANFDKLEAVLVIGYSDMVLRGNAERTPDFHYERMKPPDIYSEPRVIIKSCSSLPPFFLLLTVFRFSFDCQWSSWREEVRNPIAALMCPLYTYPHVYL
jgi:hypothetical protein